MQERFDYRTYWSLLSRIGATHRVAQFADFRDGVSRSLSAYCAMTWTGYG